jgi:primosomal protein N''
MAKKHSIDTIAEVLIDKLTDMERVASRIETASKTDFKIDTSELKELFSEHKKVILNQLENEKSILRSLKQLKEKNNTRLPNWMLACLFASYLITFGVMIFLYYSK